MTFICIDKGRFPILRTDDRSRWKGTCASARNDEECRDVSGLEAPYKPFYKEFADEDRKLAEAGMSDFAAGLAGENAR